MTKEYHWRALPQNPLQLVRLRSQLPPHPVSLPSLLALFHSLQHLEIPTRLHRLLPRETVLLHHPHLSYDAREYLSAGVKRQLSAYPNASRPSMHMEMLQRVFEECTQTMTQSLRCRATVTPKGHQRQASNTNQ